MVMEEEGDEDLSGLASYGENRSVFIVQLEKAAKALRHHNKHVSVGCTGPGLTDQWQCITTWTSHKMAVQKDGLVLTTPPNIKMTDSTLQLEDYAATAMRNHTKPTSHHGERGMYATMHPLRGAGQGIKTQPTGYNWPTQWESGGGREQLTRLGNSNDEGE